MPDTRASTVAATLTQPDAMRFWLAVLLTGTGVDLPLMISI
jgi:hypothetical protein